MINYYFGNNSFLEDNNYDKEKNDNQVNNELIENFNNLILMENNILLKKINENRDLKNINLKKLMSAQEALENKLIDEIGNFYLIIKRDYPNCKFLAENKIYDKELIFEIKKKLKSVGLGFILLLILFYKFLSFYLKVWIMKKFFNKEKNN